MAGQFSKKRKVEEGMKGKLSRPVKKFKKQTDYHSDSSASESESAQDFQAVNLQDSDDEVNDNDEFNAEDLEEENLSEAQANVGEGAEAESEVTDASNSDSEEEDEDEDDSDTNSNPNLIKKRKRNDPETFATSMSKILGSKLSTSKRSDPVLSRSAAAIQASKEITDSALEKKAKHKLREERKAALDKGRVRDVLGASTTFDTAHGSEGGETQRSVSETMEVEKRLRKTAQRGVVKLFNAVRAAQIKGEEAAKEARAKGVVSQGRREEKINEMSKKGFLDLIAGGGTTNI
ncbi:hypothetical protein B7463_g4816, partial [Scytalidium lignicola]